MEDGLDSQLRVKLRSVPVTTLVCIFLLMIPPFLLLCYVNTFGVNVILSDDWQKVSLVRRTIDGPLSFSDLFVQFDEHRTPFPNLLFVAIEILTRYDTVAVMFSSWVLICLASLVIFHAYRRQFHWNSSPKLLLIFLPALLLLFSFRQWESMLWATMFQIYLMILGVVATFSLLEMSKKIDIWFILSLLAATLASFSYLVGLATWPVGLFQIVISKREKILRHIILWCLAGAFVFVAYFWGYVKPSYHPPFDYVLTEPLKAAGYFFAFVGSPLGWDYTVISVIIGIVATMVTVLVLVFGYRRRILGNNSVWLSFVLFAALSSLITAVGRGGYGIEQATASRYTPITLLGAVGLYFLVLSFSGKTSAERRSFGTRALLCLILVGIIATCVVGYYGGWSLGPRVKFEREMGAYVLLTYKIQSDENTRNYLNASIMVVTEQAEFLEEKKLNVFSQSVVNTSSLIPMNSHTFFALESINGEPLEQNTEFVIDSGQQETMTIVGWAVDTQAEDVASTVFIIIDGNVTNPIPVFYGLDRPGVADSYGNAKFRFSGYIATFASSILSKGKHVVSLEVVSNDGYHYYYEDQVLSLIVK